MVTYRKSLERRGWHRPWPIRILSVFIGLVLLVAGVAIWELETMYGGDPDRQEYVIGWDDELGGAVVLGENGEIVYHANDIDDAESWVEAQRGGRDYTVPILLFAASAIFVLVGVAPSPRKEGSGDDVSPLEVSAERHI